MVDVVGDEVGPRILDGELHQDPAAALQVEGEHLGQAAGGVQRPVRGPEQQREPLGAALQPLAGAQHERHVAPAVGVHPQLRGHVRVGGRVVGDPLGLAIAVELPEHDVGRIERPERGDHRLPGRLQVLGPERERRLHRHLGRDLEQVGDQHVQRRPGRVVELRPIGDVEGLRDVDLHLLDALAIPDPGDHRVGEPQHVDVLGRLLAQEVVDPEDLLLVEHACGRARRARGSCPARCRTASRRPPSCPWPDRAPAAPRWSGRTRSAARPGSGSAGRRRPARRGSARSGPAAAPPSSFRKPPPANSRSGAKPAHCSSVGAVPNSVSTSCTWPRKSSWATSPRPLPTSFQRRGSSPRTYRSKKAGSTIRLARSPVAP